MSTVPKKRGRYQDFVGDRAITVHDNKQGGYDIIAHRDPTHIKRVSNAGAEMKQAWLESGSGLSMKDYLKTYGNPLKGKKVGSRGYSLEEYYAKDAHRHPKVRQLSHKPKIAELTPQPMNKLKPRTPSVKHNASQHVGQHNPHRVGSKNAMAHDYLIGAGYLPGPDGKFQQIDLNWAKQMLGLK